MVLLAALAATVYVIWQNRNSAYWDQVIMTVSKVVHYVKVSVKQRIIQILSAKVKDVDRLWIQELKVGHVQLQLWVLALYASLGCFVD